MRLSAALLGILTIITACGSGGGGSRQGPADAGADAALDAAPARDAGREAWGCACAQAERCDACIAKIGECCYDDPSIEGQATRLTEQCERTGACAACCEECAAKSCDELVAAGACPPAPSTPWTIDNGLIQDLGASPLSTAALQGQTGLAELLVDPGFHTFFSYVVQCALPEGEEVEVGEEVFAGAYGLAPQWAEGPCDLDCQRWVSACMLARANSYGVTVAFYATSQHPAMQERQDDSALYPEQEGAFYGNLFLDPPVEYTCRGDGRDPLLGTFRICSKGGNQCGLQRVGTCGAIDGETGEASARHACEGYDVASRTYTRCHDRASIEGGDDFPPGTTTYDQVITTWLARSAFQEGLADACEDAAPFPPYAPDDEPGGAGAVCDNDDDCAIEEGLHCDARPARGICTRPCTDSPDIAAEEDECGNDATCQSAGTPEGYCTAACAPHSRGGDCETGQICTSLWMRRTAPDAPGCRPFCSSDAECPPTSPCDRFGACGFGVDPSRLPDGEPCTLPDPGGTCRGQCIPADADPSHGLCGSAINLALTEDCPDDPTMPPVTGDDDFAVCLYRRCEVDEDCTPPLTCVPTAHGDLCQY